MSYVTSVSFDSDCVKILEKLPQKKRSKFIREKVKSPTLPSISLVLNDLNNDSITIDELESHIDRLNRLVEARRNR